jgi:uncharacterized protein
LLANAGSGAAAPKFPALTASVNDHAAVLTAETEKQLISMFGLHRANAGNSIVLVTLKSSAGQAPDAYASALFEHWRTREVSDEFHAMVVFFGDQTKLQVRVSEGAQNLLSAAQIETLNNNIAPKLASKNINEALLEAATAVTAQMDGQTALAPAQAAADAEPAANQTDDEFLEVPDMDPSERLMIGAFVFGILGLFTLIGIFTPAMGWGLYFFLIPFWGVFPMLVVGGRWSLRILVVYLIAFPILRLIFGARNKKVRRDRGRAAITAAQRPGIATLLRRVLASPQRRKSKPAATAASGFDPAAPAKRSTGPLSATNYWEAAKRDGD